MDIENDPVLAGDFGSPSSSPVLAPSVRTHELLFREGSIGRFENIIRILLPQLNNYIESVGIRWAEEGYVVKRVSSHIFAKSKGRYQIGITEICSILGYGSDENPITAALKGTHPGTSLAGPATEKKTASLPDSTAGVQQTLTFRQSIRLAHSISRVILGRFDDPNILPYVHVTLCFLYYASMNSVDAEIILPSYP